MVYAKNNNAPFIPKSSNQRLIGAAKSAVRLLDNDVSNSIISALG